MTTIATMALSRNVGLYPSEVLNHFFNYEVRLCWAALAIKTARPYPRQRRYSNGAVQVAELWR